MLLEIGSITWVLAIILATHLENGNFTNITSKGLRMDQAATPWVEGLTIGQVLRTTIVRRPSARRGAAVQGSQPGLPLDAPSGQERSRPGGASAVRPVVVTRDLDAAVAFWSNVIGLEVARRTPTSANLDNTLLLVLVDEHGPEWRSPARLGRSAVQVDAHDLAGVEARVERSGRLLSPSRLTTTGQQQQIVCLDPDNNVVLVVRRVNGDASADASRGIGDVRTPDGDPADEVRAQIRELARGLYRGVRLTHGDSEESAAFENTIFMACREPGGIDFDYAPKPADPSNPDRGFILQLMSYRIESTGTIQVLEQIAREHRRIIRTVRDSRAARILRER